MGGRVKGGAGKILVSVHSYFQREIFAAPWGPGPRHPHTPSRRTTVSLWHRPGVTLLLIVAMSERSERKKFFLKRGVGSLTVAPDRRRGGSRTVATGVEVESRFFRSVHRIGKTPGRRGGDAARRRNAGAIGRLSNFFPDKYFRFSQAATRAGDRKLPPAVTGIGERSGRVRNWRPFGCCDLHRVGGFGSWRSVSHGTESLRRSAVFAGGGYRGSS